MWLQRATERAGRSLGQQRDRLFELAQLQRHHLVLDLNAVSGLLTWEAVRRTPEGRVWALAWDPESGEALREQAERLPELERPVILIGQPAELEHLMTLRGEEEIQFDRMLARNPLPDHELERAPFHFVAARLLPEGAFCFVQVAPRLGQRLYQLVSWDAAESDERLRAKVEQAEEAIYLDEDDPLVNWDMAALEDALREAGFAEVKIVTERVPEQRRITAAHLERWFDEEEQTDQRPSYAQRLREGGLEPEELERVATLYRRQLEDELVTWHSTQFYVTAVLG